MKAAPIRPSAFDVDSGAERTLRTVRGVAETYAEIVAGTGDHLCVLVTVKCACTLSMRFRTSCR